MQKELFEGAHHHIIQNNVCLSHKPVDFPPHGFLTLTVCKWLIGKQLPNLLLAESHVEEEGSVGAWSNLFLKATPFSQLGRKFRDCLIFFFSSHCAFKHP